MSPFTVGETESQERLNYKHLAQVTQWYMVETGFMLRSADLQFVLFPAIPGYRRTANPGEPSGDANA